VLVERPGDGATHELQAGLHHEGHRPVAECEGGATELLLLADQRDGLPARRSEPAERGDRLRPADAVGGQTDVALQLLHGRRGLGPEDGVLAPGVEAEGVELALERPDVVAPEHGGAEEEEPVAQAVTALVERPPGLGADHAVDAETPLGLEVAHGLLGDDPELGVLLLRWERVAEREEAPLQVADCLPAVVADDADRRTGRLGHAPTVSRG
jgi:hypothetical protein